MVFSQHLTEQFVEIKVSILRHPRVKASIKSQIISITIRALSRLILNYDDRAATSATLTLARLAGLCMQRKFTSNEVYIFGL